MSNRTDYIASLVKGLTVIECFSADNPRLSTTEVSVLTKLDRASARRCLLTLVEAGYADFDGKFYTLTPRVLRLGISALATMSLPSLVQPWIDQLSEQTQSSVSVSILDEGSIVYVARAAQKRVLSIGLMPGSRLPAHCTSMGRVLLAGLPPKDVVASIKGMDLTPRTPFSETDPEVLLDVIDRTRENGFAIVDQELELGLRSISVPLFNARKQVVAAVNIGVGLTQKDASELENLFLQDLLRVQSGLARVLS
ncbi:MAG: IclR family transcriptional regulator C-terminal domain-containing protein [Pseudomonadota bacterium]